METRGSVRVLFRRRMGDDLFGAAPFVTGASRISAFFVTGRGFWSGVGSPPEPAARSRTPRAFRNAQRRNSSWMEGATTPVGRKQ